MDEMLYNRIDAAARILHVDFSGKELATLAVKKGLTEDQMKAVSSVFDYMAEKKHDTVIQTLLNLSRLPLKAPKTFDNYDFDYSDAPEAPVRIVGKHLSGLRDALRRHICGKAA